MSQSKDERKIIQTKDEVTSCIYPLAAIQKAFFNAELQGHAPKKEDIVILLYQYTIAILIRKAFSLQLIYY